MEIREFALRVVASSSLEDKLTPPRVDPTAGNPGDRNLTDEDPRVETVPTHPSRPADLDIVSEVRVPSIRGMPDPAQRIRILHAFANHELQATELFAWALLSFPDAPGEFRRGLLTILLDEQRHTRMYMKRIERLGGRFGDFPVTGYFWNRTRDVKTPLEFICAMSLTFENANLDMSLDYAAAARECGDEVTAGLLEQVHADEATHVRFGWQWLEEWTPAHSTPWETFQESLKWPLRPARARGVVFHRSGREQAGLDEDFIQRLSETPPVPPFGTPSPSDRGQSCRD